MAWQRNQRCLPPGRMRKFDDSQQEGSTRLEAHLASRRGGELNHCAPAGNSGTFSPPPRRSTPWMKRRNAATRSACCAVPGEATGVGCGSSAFSSALGLAKEKACAHADIAMHGEDTSLIFLRGLAHSWGAHLVCYSLAFASSCKLS